jgi:hypothetical protein
MTSRHTVGLPRSGWFFEPHGLRSREWVQGKHVNPMLGDPGPHAYEESQVHDRCKHHPLHRELLDAIQQGFSCGAVPFPRLLLVQLIDIGIAPIGIGTSGVKVWRSCVR